MHAQNPDRRVGLVADVAGWGLRGVSKEGRLTLEHTGAGHAAPASQVNKWQRPRDPLQTGERLSRLLL